MGKVYVQHTGSAWNYSGSIVATGSVNSGTFSTKGYKHLVGGIYISGSLTSTSGLVIRQSFDGGSNWDYVTNYAPSTVGASVYDITVYGDKMMITASPGATDITAFRALFYLLPV